MLGVTGVGEGVGSAYLFVGIGVCLLFAILQIMREKRKQAVKDEEERIAGIADTHELESVEMTAFTESNDSESTVDNTPCNKTDTAQESAKEMAENTADNINVCADVVDDEKS